MNWITYSHSGSEATYQDSLQEAGRLWLDERITRTAKVLGSFQVSRGPYREALLKSVSEHAPDLLSQLTSTTEMIRQCSNDLTAGNLSKVAASKKIRSAVGNLEKNRPLFRELHRLHSNLTPAVEELKDQLFREGLYTNEKNWEAEIDEFGPISFRMRRDGDDSDHDDPPAEDDDEGGWGGGGDAPHPPPPFNLSLNSPFVRDRVDHSSGLLSKATIYSLAGSSFYMDLASAVVGGGSGGQVVLGGDIQYPAGYKIATITATVEWRFEGVAIGVGGGSGGGADAVIEASVFGSNPIRGTRTIHFVIAPILWINVIDDRGVSYPTIHVPVDINGGRLTLMAGAAAHVWSALSGETSVLVRGTVHRINVVLY